MMNQLIFNILFWVFVFIVIVIVLGIWEIYNYNKREREAEGNALKFTEIFNVDAPKNNKEVQLLQNFVDLTLQRLASVFDTACKSEEDFFNKNKKDWSPFSSEMQASVKKLREHQDNVQKTKTGFWEARNVVKALGFKIRENYKDYFNINYVYGAINPPEPWPRENNKDKNSLLTGVDL